MNRETLLELEALAAERARRRAARTAGGYCPHKPHPKQQEFLAYDGLEALYGGAAAGGKSDALLMAALQDVHVPGYSSLVLRRTYADLALAGAIMDRAKAWLIPQGVAWTDKDKRFTFPSSATLTFGYLDSEQDKFRYASAEFQCICFDELTQFPEGWYRFLFSRLRKLAGAKVRLRMRSASNPGGIGHEWVKRRFVDEETREGRMFVRALLEDNPSVDAKGYIDSLAELDANTRQQLLEGKWVRDAAGLVYHYDHRNDIADLPPCDAWTYLLGLDFGVRDATAYVVLAWRENDPNVYVVESWKERGKPPSDVAATVLALSERYPFAKIVGDIGGMGLAFAEEMRRRFSIPIEPAQKTNKLGFIGLLNGALEHGELRVLQVTNHALIREWLELPWSDETHQKEADGFDNHLTDACLYAWRAANAFHQRPLPPKPDAGTRAYYDEMERRLEEQAEEELRRAREGDWL